MMYGNVAWTRISEKRNELTKIFEPIQPYILIALAKKLGKVAFIDVGANVGCYSVFFGIQDFVEEVITFEPLETCFEEIKKNILLNKLQFKTKLFPVAVSDKIGNDSFIKISDYAGDGGLTSTYLLDGSKKEVIQVQTVTLDSAVVFRDRNIVIKMDIEGHEFAALRGARNLLCSNSGFLQVEIHSMSVYRDATLGYLESLGWKNLFAIGADHFFSNITNYHQDSSKIELLEYALTDYLGEWRQSAKPSRRKIFPGITLEIDSSHAQSLKKAMKRLSWKW